MSDDCPICGWWGGLGDRCIGCGWPAAHTLDDERGLDVVPAPMAPTARELFEDCSWDDSQNAIGEPEVVVELRRFDSLAALRPVAAGWQDSSKGVSCTSRSAWEAKRSAVADTKLYDYVLRDTIEVHLLFWASYHDEPDVDAFIEMINDDQPPGTDSEQNVVETYQWLVEELNAPTDCEPVEERFEMRRSDQERAVGDPGSQADLGGWSA